MNKDSYLFLFGGNPSQEEASVAFAKKAGGAQAKIALLLIYRDGWQEYLPRYTKYWIEDGVKDKNIHVIISDQNGKIDYSYAKEVIQSSTGIFIGGGHTETYHAIYTSEPFKSLIQNKYNSGVPIAGNSAGALLSTTTVLLSPIDTNNEKAMIINGLGLLSNVLISVHYTKWNDAENLKKGLLKTGIKIGYGIDDQACLIFKNNKVHSYLGEEHVHILEIEE
ncbi:peptidase S51 [Aquibacillus halophilus]|uniref:Peptidase S51 n=1 Tax=Aquibacillus halophilus TaxID=930132 RepID=A0A6A8DIV5_9BACI|nr:Type 1 glutamine amidotransferase-like domain-containing protein [Aquibacillus halophilus]MRH43681.1 peptidase S51 [Aquibacillus halophilus]